MIEESWNYFNTLVLQTFYTTYMLLQEYNK